MGGEISDFLPKTRWSCRFGESRSSGWMSSHPVQGREDGAEPSWVPAAGRAFSAEIRAALLTWKAFESRGKGLERQRPEKAREKAF